MREFTITCDRCGKEGRYRYVFDEIGDQFLDGLEYEDWASVWPDLVRPFRSPRTGNYSVYHHRSADEDTADVCANCLTRDETEQLHEELALAVEAEEER